MVTMMVSQNTDGSDLFEATKTAIALERSYGMGEKLASYGDLRRRHIEGLGHVDPALLARVDSILQEQFDRAKNILLRYREACTVLADGGTRLSTGAVRTGGSGCAGFPRIKESCRDGRDRLV